MLKLRRQIIVVLTLLGGISTAGQVVITPSMPPPVNAGATYQFTANAPVRWSMAPGSQGTIDPATGVYTAPNSVTSQQSYGGCQVLPNNHILNTRIDSLPTHPMSSTWIAGAGGVPVNYLPSFPVNYVNGSAQTQEMVFAYTPANNGSFIIPPYPIARIEGGWFSLPLSGIDRHLLVIDPTSCSFQEIYDLYSVGTNTYNPCPLCTSQSGVKYSNSTYNLPVTGGVDAAGLYIMPLSLRLQELEQAVASGGTIQHALRFTLQNGYINSSFVWPATAYTNEGGVIPYGARFRLRPSFDASSFSPIAKILLTQLKQYGIILADGGYGWQITTEYAKWPPAYLDAFVEIANASIGPSNFEAVDESSLEVSATSGSTTLGAETVIATTMSPPPQSVRQQVVLTGVTLNLPNDQKYIQSGTPAQQFTAFINGTSDRSITWSMNPTVGTLSSAGLYTPPANVSAAAVTTITAKSVANPAVAATMQLTVLPTGTIRIVNGQTTPYTDSHGNVWQASTGDDGGYPYDNGGNWPSTPDIYLYKVPFYALDSGGNDIRFDITVPNGNYQITAKFAATNVSGPGQESCNIEAQGQIAYANVDVYAAAGGLNKPVDFVIPATVVNGQLSFVVRHLTGFNFISALQIAPATGIAGRPSPPTNLTVTHVE